jgi:hypothetical protein
MIVRIFALVAGVLLASPALALTLDFEEFGHGDIVTGSQGVVITTTNTGGGPDLGVAFDTDETGTADEDLQFNSPSIAGGSDGWTMGNLSPDTHLGNVLIIQEHSKTCDTVLCTDPDDEGSRPAGSIDLDFSALGSFSEFSMDLVDVESSTAEPGSVVFYLGDVQVASVGFMDFLSDPTVVYGDNSANRISVLSGVRYDRVTVNLGGSGAIDNVTAAAVPEPSAALLFALGALAVGRGARRR